jgi:hypothetical protein
MFLPFPTSHRCRPGTACAAVPFTQVLAILFPLGRAAQWMLSWALIWRRSSLQWCERSFIVAVRRRKRTQFYA